MIGETAAATLGGGRYQLGAVLGTGGMATVLSATDTVLGRPVAVKLFREDLDQDSAARARTEMQTLASFAHPGLVSVYDAGTEPDSAGTPQPFLVMELVDGPTLAARCKDGSLTPELLTDIGAGLAEALQYVHDRGVIHRDVKPANILLSTSGAKLADFGIARIVDGARHTGTGLTIGTAPYLAPEQVTGKDVGPKTDVYALGLVLLEGLTGHREYTGGPVETAMARLHRAPVIPPSLPAPWPQLLTAMTAMEPGDRPSAGEVAAVLRGGPVTAPIALADSQGGLASSDATSVLDAGGSTSAPGASDATSVMDAPDATSVLDATDATSVLDTGQGRTRVVPRVVATEADPNSRSLVNALGRTSVRIALALVVALLAVVVLALVLGQGGSDAPNTNPSTPASTSPLEQHINDLDKAVSR